MDTFDALGAKYDFPINSNQLDKIAKTVGLKNFKIKKKRLILILNGIK